MAGINSNDAFRKVTTVKMCENESVENPTKSEN